MQSEPAYEIKEETPSPRQRLSREPTPFFPQLLGGTDVGISFPPISVRRPSVQRIALKAFV